MVTKYYLQPGLLAPLRPLKITKNEFERLAKARQTLFAAFPIEQNFDLLIGNFLELETAALSIAATNMVRNLGGYRDAFEMRATLNRRVVNLLTAARLFIDQLPQRVAACGRDKSLVVAKCVEMYEADFEYRFMEALRNHVQHCGSGVHGVKVGGRWLPDGKRERQEYAVVPYTMRQKLEQDGNFKKKVLSECPERIDVLHASRVYVESLGAIHEVARSLVKDAVKTAREAVERAIKRYEKFSKGSAVGLAAFAAANGRIEGRVPIVVGWEDVRADLERRHGSLVNLRKRFVSGAPGNL